MKVFGALIVMLLVNSALCYTTQEGLQATWLDELHAVKTYSAVLEKFGDIKPFSNIINAERRHLNAIESMASQLGISLDKTDAYVPPDFASVGMACKVGVQAEIDNVALYENVIPHESNENVLNMYRHLRDASLLRHLPALQRCAH